MAKAIGICVVYLCFSYDMNCRAGCQVFYCVGGCFGGVGDSIGWDGGGFSAGGCSSSSFVGAECCCSGSHSKFGKSASSVVFCIIYYLLVVVKRWCW